MTRQRTNSPRVLKPLYAVLGATELAVEKLADLGANAVGHTPDERPQSRVAQAGRVLVGARQVPALAINQAIDTVVRTQEHYAGLAERGQRLAGSKAPVQQTGDLLRQAGQGVARGRAAAAGAAQRTRSAASETMHSARGGAEDIVEAVAHPTRPGSVARPPRAPRTVRPPHTERSTAPVTPVSPSADPTTTQRPKPRRSRVNAASARTSTSTARATSARTATPDEPSRARTGVPAGSGVEAGATMPTKRPSVKSAAPKKPATKKATAKSSPEAASSAPAPAGASAPTGAIESTEQA
ncbi:MAG: hypothetical protein Q4P32_04485 [Micrococcales bacterium]|nr:hypothetical protein [Micrococcales bacterium]